MTTERTPSSPVLSEERFTVSQMPSPEVTAALSEAMQMWTQGNQQGAIERLRPPAAEDDRASLNLIAWFLSQLGQPGWTEGIRYARRAAELGMPQAVMYFYGNLFGDASLRGQTPELARLAIQGSVALDPVPNALQSFQQGDQATAIALLDVSTDPRPYPEAWAVLIDDARADLELIRGAASAVGTEQAAASAAIEESRTRITEQQTSVETRANRLLELIEQITNAEATSYFDDEAKRYGGEASKLWWGGLAVIAVAALASIAPLAIYYYDKAQSIKPWLSGSQLLGAHTAPALALGAVAGVLLARARGRDRARQRARDLSVALGTMFVYSDQIQDPAEKQGFIREMGRTVIESFLRQDSPTSDEGASLLNALRGR